MKFKEDDKITINIGDFKGRNGVVTRTVGAGVVAVKLDRDTKEERFFGEDDMDLQVDFFEGEHRDPDYWEDK